MIRGLPLPIFLPNPGKLTGWLVDAKERWKLQRTLLKITDKRMIEDFISSGFSLWVAAFAIFFFIFQVPMRSQISA